MEQSSKWQTMKVPLPYVSLIMSSIKSLGTVNPFNMNLVMAGINIVSVSSTLLIVDRVGRRYVVVH